ncbi:MAG: glycosyl hydrolase family 65 protein [Methyloceanibacter sp.]|jgi:alpha,alpha-trehalase
MSNDWVLSYEDYDADNEGAREVLCALGNGYMVSRAAAPDARAGDKHYPGTYLSGGYNRLATDVAGQQIENEDLVNLPNWLPLNLQIGNKDDWLQPDRIVFLDYRQALDLRAGILTRTLRFRNDKGQVTRWEEKRIVSMDNQHLAALSVTVLPENWSGPMTLRLSVDGAVTNAGVPRYRALNGQHLETLDRGTAEGSVLWLRSRMVQSRREIALATRNLVEIEGEAITPTQVENGTDEVCAIYPLQAREGCPIHVEKIAGYFNSKDRAITEPLTEAVTLVQGANRMADLLQSHSCAWRQIWEQCDIQIKTGNGAAQLRLRLHVFHLLQTVHHSVGADVGVPPRGWHGEAYRGHIMWDELFIFPYINLRMPRVTRALLLYRYRRLPEARRAAREAGFKGAMFPWQSGSNGREESQQIHLNPMSGRWIADVSWRQRHIGAAICYNIWQYYEATGDTDFLTNYGAELFFEIARFWSSLANRRKDGRYEIDGVMGPDEFHTAYPTADPSAPGGINNNAYTNVMVAWLMARALDLLDRIPSAKRRRICERLGLNDEEFDLWRDIGCNLFIPLQEDGIISQFEGYADLEEFDWDGYRERYGSLQRLDRILEKEAEDLNRFKISKQADVLMLFYLFSREEIEETFDRLGYAFTPDQIPKNIHYYVERTSHGSSLSWMTHAWVLARADRERSWQVALRALANDVENLQHGTVSEGIHLGAMAGTVDLMQRCYTGIEMRDGVLRFNPRLPDEVDEMQATLQYRRHTLDVEVSKARLKVSSRAGVAAPIRIAYREHSSELDPGQSLVFNLSQSLAADY